MREILVSDFFYEAINVDKGLHLFLYFSIYIQYQKVLKRIRNKS